MIHFDTLCLRKFWRLVYFFVLRISRPRLVFVSDFARNRLSSVFDTSNYSINIIHNAVQDRFFKLYPSSYALNSSSCSSPRYRFIGRFSPVKRIYLALRTFSLLLLKQDNAEFVIQSDLSFSQLQVLCSMNNISAIFLKRVKLLPYHHDVCDFYHSVDIVSSTSLTESFSLIAIEAVAMQKKFFSYNSPSIEILLPDFQYNFIGDSLFDFSEFICYNSNNNYSFPCLDKFRSQSFLNSYSKL